jgi:NADPH:quinone reductase-like Zn-dependent oxidoreductase
MKAFTYVKYGNPDVLRLEEVDKPTPEENEALIRVHAVSLNCYDWHYLRADIFLVRLMGVGFLWPKNPRLGADFAGCVEAVGRDVKQFKPGDDVFGCKGSSYGNGAFAEYICIPEGALARKPSNLTFEEAAAVPMAAVTALQALRDKGQVQPGQNLLINGASGGVGTFAVQIAKALGAKVTAVCSTRNVELARSLGADRLIDYTKEDFTGNGQRYDVILGVNGFHRISAYKRALTPKGVYVMVGGTFAQLLQGMLLAPRMSEPGGRKAAALSADIKQKDLVFLTGLLEAGKVAPCIDKRYRFTELPEAFRYLGAGHARGKIVVTVTEDGMRSR